MCKPPKRRVCGAASLLVLTRSLTQARLSLTPPCFIHLTPFLLHFHSYPTSTSPHHYSIYTSYTLSNPSDFFPFDSFLPHTYLIVFHSLPHLSFTHCFASLFSNLTTFKRHFATSLPRSTSSLPAYHCFSTTLFTLAAFHSLLPCTLTLTSFYFYILTLPFPFHSHLHKKKINTQKYYYYYLAISHSPTTPLSPLYSHIVW